MKQKQDEEAKRQQVNNNIDELKDAGQRISDAISVGVFSIFTKAKEAKEKIITDDVK